MFKFLNRKPDKPLPENDFKDFEVPKTLGASTIPSTWNWITKLNGLPKMVAEGLKEYGTLEGPGTLNNKKIVNWADEVAKLHPTTYTNWAADWYNKDSIAWCGLYAALIAARSANGTANRMPPPSYLSALAWSSFGVPVDWHSSLNNIYMGDIAVFVREGGGHVGIVIGISKDKQYIVVLGGNQSDAVNIKMVAANRLYAIRRVPYNVRPASAKCFIINTNGLPVSTNEG
jgi:uncharacterized protein (TIGR02594 family)